MVLRERDNELFKDFYFLLLKHYEPLLSVSRIDKVSFEKLFIFDSHWRSFATSTYARWRGFAIRARTVKQQSKINPTIPLALVYP